LPTEIFAAGLQSAWWNAGALADAKNPSAIGTGGVGRPLHRPG